MLLACLGADLLDILNFMTLTQALGHTIENFVLFLDILQLPFPFILRFMVLVYSSSPVTQVPSQAFPGGCLVRPFSKAIFGSMWFPLELRHPSLLSQHTVTLGTTMVGGFLTLLFASQ